MKDAAPLLLSGLIGVFAVFSPWPIAGRLAALVTLGFGFHAAYIMDSPCAGFQALLESILGLIIGFFLGVGAKAMHEINGWPAWLIIFVVVVISVGSAVKVQVETKNLLNGTFGCAV